MRRVIVLAGLMAVAASAAGADWPTWCGSPSRNPVSAESGLPDRVGPGAIDPITGDPDLSAVPAALWAVRLGTGCWASPVVAGGRVLIGCNNGGQEDPRYPGDRNVLLCLDAASGRRLWQLNTPKGLNDCPQVGNIASPTVAGDRVYVMLNSSDVCCLDLDGLADGNDGPELDEVAWLAMTHHRPRRSIGPPEDAPPFLLTVEDADVLWRKPAAAYARSNPHDAATSAILLVGDRLLVGTSNGINDTIFKRRPERHPVISPEAPSLLLMAQADGRWAEAWWTACRRVPAET